MMESREEEVNREIFRTVSKLANLLRRSGSAVLTNNRALSLTWTGYQNISKALAMFSNNSLDPGPGERTDMDMKLILDLEYLSTFLARVPSLRLLHTERGRERGHEGLSLGELAGCLDPRSQHGRTLVLHEHQLLSGL